MSDSSGERRRIAGYLAEHGPTPGDRLAERLGLTPGRFWPLINCGWFDIVAGGWGLTGRGRREALGTPAPDGAQAGSR
jgi:hypothetical protein